MSKRQLNDIPCIVKMESFPPIDGTINATGKCVFPDVGDCAVVLSARVYEATDSNTTVFNLCLTRNQAEQLRDRIDFLLG